MQAKDIMNRNPVCAMPHMKVQEVAEMMVECDCGSIPVIDNEETMKPLIGMVTDRDIVCRLLAQGQNPLEHTVKDCMSSPAIAVKPEDTLEHVADVMEQKQIRRIPVCDDTGAVVGLITQAHIAKHGSTDQAGELLKNISRKTPEPSQSAGRR